MTLAAGPEAWQGAMAAGLLGMGSVVAGSSEVAGPISPGCWPKASNPVPIWRRRPHRSSKR